MHSKWGLMCGALVGASFLALDPAAAQSVSDSEKIERLQRATEQLQKQLKTLQDEIAQTKKKTEKVEAKVEAAPARYPAAPAGALITKGPPPPPPPERVKVTLGGFVTADNVLPPHNAGGDNWTPLAAIPLPLSPPFNEHQLHCKA